MDTTKVTKLFNIPNIFILLSIARTDHNFEEYSKEKPPDKDKINKKLQLYFDHFSRENNTIAISALLKIIADYNKEWECLFCTYINPSNNLKCEVCQKNRINNKYLKYKQKYLELKNKLQIN